MDAPAAAQRSPAVRIPRLRGADATLRFLRDGYAFGGRGFAEVRGDAFRTRLLGRDAVVVRGTDAARRFYEGGRFSRAGAVPRSVTRLLQDDESVQTLEGTDHRPRKALFLDLVANEGRREALVDRFAREWDRMAAESTGSPVSAIDASALALTRAVLDWSGIDAPDDRARRLSAELLSMVDNAGRFGPPNWVASARRLGTERWAREVVVRLRNRAAGIGRTPAERIALHRQQAQLLSTEVAAIELLNVLRPTVAVAHFIAFAVHALHHHPQWRERMADPAARDAFSLEVRRRYPFFPMIGGRATRVVEWAGELLPWGQWMLLDLYGTDHSPALWERPDDFDPGRFLGTDSAPAVVAQGAGDYAGGHHCPGEPLTGDLVAAALDRLVHGPRYAVPAQDLRISLRRRYPARPEDGMLVTFAPARTAAR